MSLLVNFIVLPSGISAAMTATSASNHRQYFTYFGYSALHNSARCLPVAIRKQKLILISYYKKNHPKKKLLLKKKKSQQCIKFLDLLLCYSLLLCTADFPSSLSTKKKEIEAETIVTSIFWPRICLLCILPVLTPRFAASDWIMSAKINPISITHSSWK